MKKLRVLVCGTTFGRFYLEGIAGLDEFYELSGILSTGSQHSKNIADKYRVPLYTNMNNIDKAKFDVACVVIRSGIVGGRGTEIAMELLHKGIHVIQEQPIHYNDIGKCYKIARTNKRLFMVNTFYPYLRQVSKYLSLCEGLLKRTEACYLSAGCSLQVLYPMVDLLGRICGGFYPFKIKENSLGKNGLFDIFCGEIKGIPFDVRIQNQLNGNNPDNYFHLLHRFTLYTEAGSLSLTETNGEIIWKPRYIVPKNNEGILDPYLDSRLMKLPLEEVIQNKEVTFQSMYEKVWPDGIRTYLREAYKAFLKNSTKANQMQRNLESAKIWNEIGKLIGGSEQLPEKNVTTFSINEILEDIASRRA